MTRILGARRGAGSLSHLFSRYQYLDSAAAAIPVVSSCPLHDPPSIFCETSHDHGCASPPLVLFLCSTVRPSSHPHHDRPCRRAGVSAAWPTWRGRAQQGAERDAAGFPPPAAPGDPKCSGCVRMRMSGPTRRPATADIVWGAVVRASVVSVCLLVCLLSPASWETNVSSDPTCDHPRPSTSPLTPGECMCNHSDLSRSIGR